MATDSGLTCDVDWFGRQIHDGDVERLIVVDCRPTEAYRNLHIRTAVSLSLPTLMTRRLVRRQLASSAVIGIVSQQQLKTHRLCHQHVPEPEDWKLCDVIFYDDTTTAAAAATTTESSSLCLVKLLAERFHDDGYRARILNGGFDKFHRSYPQLCRASIDDDNEADEDECLTSCAAAVSRLSLRDESTTPSVEELMSGSISPTLVMPYLYIGNAQNALDIDCLTTNGITYIVNVTNNIPNRFEDDERFHYMQIPVKDHWSQSLTAYLPSAINFIDEARQVHNGVLIHCLAGISRSVSVAVAYLMSSMCLSLDDAYERVKSCRPYASPSLNFMGQLLDFETTLKNHRIQFDKSATHDDSVDGISSSKCEDDRAQCKTFCQPTE